MKAVTAFLLLVCYLALSDAAWNCREAPRLNGAYQIDAGHGRVVARTSSYQPYMMVRNYWYRMSTLRFKHVSVGPAGLWGCDTSNRVHKFIAGNFFRSSGLSLMQVDAGGDDQVVGISTRSYAYCLRSTSASAYSGTGTLGWNYQSTRRRYYSCSPANGCWAVDSSYRVYHVQTLTPTSCSISGWTLVQGISLKMVEVGTDGRVFGVTTAGQVYERTGITTGSPLGTLWVQVPMCMTIRHVSWDLGKLWVVTTSGLVMYCTP